ncbi:MAG TPA: zinc-binding alcohol dehydrogenase family protein [Acidisarcina sp.]
MRALAIQSPGNVGLIDVSKPEPRDGELLLLVRYVGMCGTDLNSFRGKNPLVTFPRIPGHEISATVVESRSSDQRWQPGLDVTLSPYTSCGLCASCRRGRANACLNNQTLGVQRDGAMTEFITVPAEKVYAAALSLKELCIVEPLTVGFHGVARGRVEATDTVAVFGCGGVGLGAIAGASFRGARVIAIDVDDSKLAVGKQAGAVQTVNSATMDLHETLQDFTEGRGPDVVIEAIGLPQTFRAAVDEVAFTGRVVYIGYAKEPVNYETRLFVQKELDIMGARNAQPADFADVIRMLEEKRFPIEAAITVVAPLEEAGNLLRDWSKNPSHYQKIMVKMD